MSSLVGNLQDVLTLLANSFNLASLLPSLAFTVLISVFVIPKVQNMALVANTATMPDGSYVALLVLFTVFLAYLLNALNSFLIHQFEGYGIRKFWPFDLWQSNNQQSLVDLQRRLFELQSREAKTKTAYEKTPFSNSVLKRKLLDEIFEHEAAINEIEDSLLLGFPMNQASILPTQLGNAIAAAEDYPRQLYSIDSVSLWTYFAPQLSENGYAKFIEQEKSGFDLLLNSLVLLSFFGVLFGGIEFATNGLSARLVFELIAVCIGVRILYMLSIQGAISWGMTIRTAFVLYRDNLRQALKIVQPTSLKHERELWRTASKFFAYPRLAQDTADADSVFVYATTADEKA